MTVVKKKYRSRSSVGGLQLVISLALGLPGPAIPAESLQVAPVKHQLLLTPTDASASIQPDRTAMSAAPDDIPYEASGPGSFREAISSANSGDIIDLKAFTCGSIPLVTGTLNIVVNDLSILGPAFVSKRGQYA